MDPGVQTGPGHAGAGIGKPRFFVVDVLKKYLCGDFAAGLQVGGQMPVGPLAPMLWGLAVVWGNERLFYRTTDLDLVHYSFNSDSKSLEVFAMPPIGRR